MIIIYISGSGKKKTIKSKSIRHADEWCKGINSSLRVSIDFLNEKFPVEFLKSNQPGYDFCINEALQVLRLLVVLSHNIISNFPKNDDVYSYKKLFLFSPKIKKSILVSGISKALKYDYKKSSMIVDFLTYECGKNKDLWCHPVIDLDGKDVTFLVSALASPVIQRVVEHWLAEIDVDLSKKGLSYERVIIDKINKAANENSMITDYDKACSKRIKLKEGEEEIDVLFRLGNVVLVGEIKCIVTTDSPISYYRTMEILEGAANQSKRKLDFVERNIDAVFKDIGWYFDSKVDYNFIPAVINSNKLCVGFKINDVSICDDNILEKYLESSTIPMFSVNGEEHLAWFDVYSSENELQMNLEKYLEHPPQITQTEDDLEYITHQVPCLSDDSFKIVYTRLGHKDIDIKSFVTKKHPFQIKTVDDFEEKIKDIDFYL